MRCYGIVRAKGPKAKYNRQRLYKDLIKIANEVFHMGERCLKEMSKHPQPETLPFLEQLDHYLTTSAVAIVQCERRVLKGEKIPSSEKIVSIVEDHTDIIRRGESQSPTEFGHKVLITTAKSGLITQYQVFQGNPDDAHMIPDILTNHQNQYGQAPKSLCGDRRFFSADNEKKPINQVLRRCLFANQDTDLKTESKLRKRDGSKRCSAFVPALKGSFLP